MTTFQIARADGKTLEIQGKMANRHGLIAGATGTGKTVT
ncbi:helicase HerA-like domain-containing protein, partial [Neisseria sp. P0001.S004]